MQNYLKIDSQNFISIQNWELHSAVEEKSTIAILMTKAQDQPVPLISSIYISRDKFNLMQNMLVIYPSKHT